MAIDPRDLHEQAYFEDPLPVWQQLRHDQPLFRDTVDERWLLTRYDDVATVFRKASRAGGRIDGVANHLGFGLGKHFCIGYQLARAEIVAATRGLLDHLPDFRFAAGQQPNLRIDWFHRHLDRLVVETA